MVAPGFIDIHSHGRRGIFSVPTAENYLREGVTTIIEGPDGSSPLPLGAIPRPHREDADLGELRIDGRTGDDPLRGDGPGRPEGDARGDRKR